MPNPIRNYAIAVPKEGSCGLAIPHLGKGELKDAIWVPGEGLKVRAEFGSAMIALSDESMEIHFAGEVHIQILESGPGQQDAGWLVPLLKAPARTAKTRARTK